MTNTAHRHFFRCFDCLAVMGVNPSDHAEIRASGVCSCGGELHDMGAVVSKPFVTSKSACDYRCTNARGPECDCLCNGANHGSGAVVKVVRSESMVPQLKSPSEGRAMEFRAAQNNAIEAFEAAFPGARAKFKAETWLPRPTWDACRVFRDAFLHASDLKTHANRIERLGALTTSLRTATPKVAEPAIATPALERIVFAKLPDIDQGLPATSSDFAEPEIGGPGSAIDTARAWSDQQRAVFDAFAEIEGHLVVEALAGTGKTTTIMEALKYSKLRDKVYCAFNKLNADEAKQKIGIHGEAMTLNGLGYRYVRKQWPQARPDDSVESERVKEVLGRGDFDDLKNEKGTHADAPKKLIRKLVGLAKNTQPTREPRTDDLVRLAAEFELFPEDRAAKLGWDLTDLARATLAVLDLSTRPDPQGRISYDDQLWLPVVMGWATPRADLLVVDEAQDMNETQFKLARMACRVDGRLVLVGDRRQAIYGFRGADSGIMQRMATELMAKILPLTTTYRCPRLVVEMARQLVPAYNAAPGCPEGTVERSGDIDAVVTGLIPGDAVISRTNAPLMPACLKTIRRGVRAHVEGRDVGEQLADLVERLGPCTTAELLLRINQWEQERLAAVTGEEDAAAKAAESIHDHAETIRILTDGLASSTQVAGRIRELFRKSDGGPDVTFATVHKAKGKEWGRVFVLASTLKTDWSSTEHEENNLAYVAITRAKKDLVLVYDHSKITSGRRVETVSPFA